MIPDKNMLQLASNLPGSEPSKKIKKEPTGILKDLSELKRYSVFPSSKVIEGNKNGNIVRWSDVEAIINKYTNP